MLKIKRPSLTWAECEHFALIGKNVKFQDDWSVIADRALNHDVGISLRPSAVPHHSDDLLPICVLSSEAKSLDSECEYSQVKRQKMK